MKIKDPVTGKIKDVRLPKAFKNKWLKALRSGDFKQGQDFLESSDGYCCLGVACRIVHPKMKLEGKDLIYPDSFPKTYSKIKVPKILHGVAIEGLEFTHGSYNPVVAKLAIMNDNGKTFKQIATFIEKNL